MLYSNLKLFFLVASVLSSTLGGLGGSFQPSRILILFAVPFIINELPKITSSSSARLHQYQYQIFSFVTLLVLVAWASMLWSQDREITFGYCIVLSINVLPLLVMSTLTQYEINLFLKWVPRAWCVAILIALLFAAYEITTGQHLSYEFDSRGGGELSNSLWFASGFHGNYNDFSTYLVMCVNCTLLAPREFKLPIFWRALLIVGAAGAAFVILIDASRGAILSLLLLFLFSFLNRDSNSAHVFKWVAAISVCALIFYTGIFESIGNSSITEYLNLKFFNFGDEFNTNDGRLAILVAGVTGLVQTLGLGSGAGTSSLLLADQNTLIIPNPHNMIMEWALDFGVLGLFLLFRFLISTWVACRRNSASNLMIKTTLAMLPIVGTVQSHLLGYTYFWLYFASVALSTIGAQNKQMQDGKR